MNSQCEYLREIPMGTSGMKKGCRMTRTSHLRRVIHRNTHQFYLYGTNGHMISFGAYTLRHIPMTHVYIFNSRYTEPVGAHTHFYNQKRSFCKSVCEPREFCFNESLPENFRTNYCSPIQRAKTHQRDIWLCRYTYRSIHIPIDRNTLYKHRIYHDTNFT